MSAIKLTDHEWLEQAAHFIEAQGDMTKDDWLYLANEAEKDGHGLLAHGMFMQALAMEEQQAVPVPIKVLSRE